VTLQVVLGTVVIVTGVWLLSQSEEKGSLVTSKRTLAKGLVLALVTAVLWAVSILMINMAVMETPSLNDALAINMIRVIAIAVALSASALLIDRKREFLKVKPRTLAALVGGGIVALGLGWFFLTYSFISTPQSRAVPISSTTPLFSAFVAALFLHERLTVRTVVGSVLIVLGIFVIFIF
jgi:transporter family protein